MHLPWKKQTCSFPLLIALNEVLQQVFGVQCLNQTSAGDAFFSTPAFSLCVCALIPPAGSIPSLFYPKQEATAEQQ